MNGELNFSISTEGLTEKGNIIRKESNVIKEALNDINEARASLASWVSSNKDKFEEVITSKMPSMVEMTEVIDSYGDVAVQTSEKAQATENKIASEINSNFSA